MDQHQIRPEPKGKALVHDVLCVHAGYCACSTVGALDGKQSITHAVQWVHLMACRALHMFIHMYAEQCT